MPRDIWRKEAVIYTYTLIGLDLSIEIYRYFGETMSHGVYI
jgi:hypothetical protein